MLIHADPNDLVEFVFVRDVAVVLDAKLETPAVPSCAARSRASLACGWLKRDAVPDARPRTDPSAIIVPVEIAGAPLRG
jgi:hypothetical protein